MEENAAECPIDCEARATGFTVNKSVVRSQDTRSVQRPILEGGKTHFNGFVGSMMGRKTERKMINQHHITNTQLHRAQGR
jgi:hypothetical protein